MEKIICGRCEKMKYYLDDIEVSEEDYEHELEECA